MHRLTLFFETGGTGNIPSSSRTSYRANYGPTTSPGTPAGWTMVQRRPMEAHPEGRNLSFDVTLTDAQIMGLEKAREGKDLELCSDLTAVQLGAVDGWPAREHQLTMRISHEEWAKALAGLNAGAFVDVLVPITDVEDRALAARRLREASRRSEAATSRAR